MAQKSHNDMLKELGEDQRLGVMEGNIGKCVDYTRVRAGERNEQIVGDVITGVIQHGLRRGDHRYKVMHKQHEEMLFPMWITKGPYDCNEGAPAAAGAGAGKGGRRRRKTKKQRRRARSNTRNHPGRSK